MKDDPVKRLNYFDNQFLHAQDFNDEQEYHISIRRLHNSILHTSGVAQGLELIVNADKKGVTINPGVAVDALGQEIWLKKEQIRDVSSFKDKTVFVTIKYTETLTDKTEETGGEGFTRYTENDPDQNKEMIAIKEENDVFDPTLLELVLGRVTVGNDGKISIDDGVEPNRRRLAGAVGGDMEMRTLTLGSGDDKNLWPKLEGQDNKLHITTDVKVNGGLESDNAQVKTELKVASLKLTGSGDENTWPKVENQNNKLHVTTNVKVDGNLEVGGSLTATLGTNVVGADQVTDKSIPLKKLNTTFKGGGPLSELSMDPTSTVSLLLSSYSIDKPKEEYCLVHAYIKTIGGTFTWAEQSSISTDTPDTIQRVVIFKNTSNVHITINYKILQLNFEFVQPR